MKKRIIAILLLVSVLLNVAICLVFQDVAAVTAYSLPAAAVMLLVALNGISACIFKHKGNFFVLSRYNNPFVRDRAYTFTPEYEKEFSLSFFIYFAAIPFYLPLIFFTANWPQTLWVLVVLAIPQIIFAIQGAIETINNAKADKQKKQQLHQELLAQKQREEMGRWK